MHRYSNFGCKRFRTSGYFFEDVGTHCDLFFDLEDSNPSISHGAPGHDDAPTYQVWLRNCVEWLRRYRTNTPRGFEPSMWPDLENSNQNCHRILCHVMVYHYTKYGCKRFRISGGVDEWKKKVIFWGFDPILWPRPWRLEPNSVFRLTPRVTMLHKHAKFHEERSRGWHSGVLFVSLLNV